MKDLEGKPGIFIPLPQEAVDLAEQHAAALGFNKGGASEWVTEWLINTIKEKETAKHQTEVTKLAAKAHRRVDKIFGVDADD